MGHRASGDRRTLKKCKKTQIANWKVFPFELLCSETGKMWNLKLTKKGIFWEITRVPNLLSCSPLPWDDNTRECWTRGENCNINLNCLGFPSRINISLKRYYWFVYLFVYTLPYPLHPVAGFSPMIFASIWDVCHNVSPTHKAVWFNTNTQSCVSTAIFKVNKQDTGKPQALSLHQTPNTRHQTVKNTKLFQ